MLHATQKNSKKCLFAENVLAEKSFRRVLFGRKSFSPNSQLLFGRIFFAEFTYSAFLKEILRGASQEKIKIIRGRS